MRFHHSTRRGRTRSERRERTTNTSWSLLEGSSKWSQLAYCRESNIYFERRQLVAPPAGHEQVQAEELSAAEPTELAPVDRVDRALVRLKRASSSMAGYEEESQNGLATGVSALSLRHRQQQQQSSQSLELEHIRQKLVAQVEKRPFWSSKAARRMQLAGADQRLIYIYELVSFCERRELKWHFEPYMSPLATAKLNPCSSPGPTDLSSHALSRALVAPPRPLSGKAEQAAAASGRRGGPPGSPRRVGSTCHVQENSRDFSAEHIWSIEPSSRPEPFLAHVDSIELPGSSFVKHCHGCQGRGRLKCGSCDGVGYEVCPSCSGAGKTRSFSSAKSASRSSDRGSTFSSGSRRDDSSKSWKSSTFGSKSDEGSDGWKSSRNKRDDWGSSGSSGSAWVSESCVTCHGSGQKKCWACSGRSYNSCPACRGTCSLRCYQTLTISWLNHRDELFINNSDSIVSQDRLRLCSGQVLADRQAAHLEPLKLAATEGATGPSPDDSIQARQASQRLLDRHRLLQKNERLIRQRHKLTQIECHIISYEWKQRRGHFVVYGEERKVYIAKYPFKSICNIS